MEHYLILAGATGFVDHLNTINVINSSSVSAPAFTVSVPASTAATSLTLNLPEPLPFIVGPNPEPENEEVSYFWEHSVGSKTKLESEGDFFTDISAHLTIKLSPVARKRLLFSLDGKNTGYISYSALQGLVKQARLADVIKAYSQDPHLPLLIWIDDNVAGNRRGVVDAIKRGITVIQLTSTRAAETWIKINLDFLKAHDNAGEVRYISDQVRVEADKHGVVFENHDAGTQMLKYIREQGLQAPVLIYTGRKSLSLTRYVEKYKNAGSLTGRYYVLGDYIAALSAGRKDDTGWKKFDAARVL